MNTKYWDLSLTLIISFIVFVFFTVLQSAVLLFLRPENLEISTNGYENLAYANLGAISSVSSFFGILVILFFIYFKKTSIIDYLNLYLPTFKITASFIFLSFLTMFFMEFLSRGYPDFFHTDFVIESYKQAKNLPLFYLGVVILGPVFEEFLFRGFLFKGLENSFVGGHGAVFISASIFSLVHIQYGFLIILFILFPMAILFGYARLKSKSLLLPILLHCINNFLTCLVTHFEIY